MHIADILNKKLLQIGAKLHLDKESNEIGEQIAYQGIEDRFVEIIRVREEKEIWVSFHCQSVFLPSLISSDIEKIIDSIFQFLEVKMPLNVFFSNYITSPVDISNLETDEEIVLELCWSNFLRPSKDDSLGPAEHLTLREFATTIQSSAKTKKLTPYWSLTRLCFTLDRKFKTGNFPCIWVSSQEKDIPIFSIGYYDSTELHRGTAKEIKERFKEMIQSS